ncbi:MAG: hypothetical protein VW397_04175 [Candidatus Margulisiibacteriota bacterium]
MKTHLKFQFRIGITLLLSTVILNQKALAKTINYTGDYKNNPVTVQYTFSETSEENIITSIIMAENFYEKNTTHLKNKQLHKMIQYTQNEIDNEFFDWQVFKSNGNYLITFYNKKFNEYFRTTIDSSRNPMSLQGLIYLIQKDSLYLNKFLKINLITPWKSIIPIKFYVKKETVLQMNSSTIPIYVIDMEIDFFFSQFLPKTTIWVTKLKPHILLKQSGFNGNYTITNIETVLTPQHFLDN